MAGAAPVGGAAGAATAPSPRPAGELMPPPPPRAPGSASSLPLRRAPPAPRVLEEDEYTMYLEEIVERDFFPDLARLKNRLDWLEATRSGDPERIRDAQLRIQERLLARTPGGAAVGTPSVGTPLSGSSGASTPARGGAAPDEGHRAAAALAAALDAAARGGAGSPADLRLDAFLARYTSEDNASFSGLLAKVNAARAARAGPAAARAAEAAAAAARAAFRAAPDALRLEAGPAATDGFGTSGQPQAGVLGAPYAAQNALFYAPEGRPPSLAEAEARVKGPDRSVDPARTRFAHPDAAPPPQSHAPSPADGARGGGAYSLVATPSPAPGVDDSPFMTWGRLDATPLRLDPLAGGAGPDDPGAAELAAAASGRATFHIARPGKRDEVGHALAHSAGASLRGRGAGGAGGATPQRGGLSDAARRVLASRAATGARGGDTDWALRRSYASPAATPAGSRGATPRGTPAATPLRGSAAKRPREASPAPQTKPPPPPPPGASITDDLLNL